MNQQLRQGDVFLVPITDDDFERITGFSKSRTKTVALGEATGHHHTFDGDVNVLIEDATSNLAVNSQGMLIDVQTDSILFHQEHAPVTVSKGKYRRIIQREYSPAEIRNVAD